MTLLLHNVEVEGRRTDVLVRDGSVIAIEPGIPRERDMIDARGGALIAGLVDHHIHLLATAAAKESIDLADCRDVDGVGEAVARVAVDLPHGSWLRAIGCPQQIAERLTCDLLDVVAPHHRLRVLDRTGALWVLNSGALAAVGDLPELECDTRGRATGRMWRGDVALRDAIGREAPRLEPLGAQLAALGITAVTDASVTTDATAAALLAGALPQRLTLMSGGPLDAPADDGFAVGAVKIVPDERDPPSIDAFLTRIAEARSWHRAVAVHCVTALELALTLAAFEAAGSRPGDRIEHGSIVPSGAIPVIAALGLTVVTQPGFIHDRGDVYRREVAGDEQEDLYRCASLVAGGVAVAGSSDAPYGSVDCWSAMRAATSRQTAAGMVLGASERIAPIAALNLYRAAPGQPGGRPRPIVPGMAADLCLFDASMATVLRDLDPCHVAMTLIGGRIVWRR